jgi:hypothetical protein
MDGANNHPYDLPYRSDYDQISGHREYVNQAHGGYYNTPAQVYVHSASSYNSLVSCLNLFNVTVPILLFDCDSLNYG